MHIIAGIYRNRTLFSPKGEQTRPTASRLRESVFNICQNNIEGARFLDIFSGSGSMGLEALSRGAQSATFVDANKQALQCIEKNIELLKVKHQSKVMRGDVFTVLQFLKNQGNTFDIIYVDPPYRTLVPHRSSFYSEEVIKWFDANPMLAAGGTLFVEEEFNFQPKIELLERLQLTKSRKLGNAALQQYTY